MRKVLFLLGQVSDEDVEWMLSIGSTRSLAAGDVLIERGDPVDAVYIVLRGVFAVTVGTREVNRLGSGEVIGEMSFVDARPPSATVTALEPSAVFAIPRAALSARLEDDTAFAARFYRALTLFLSDRLRSTVGRLGYGDDRDMEAESLGEEELNPDVLDTIHLAGSRFSGMLRRLEDA